MTRADGETSRRAALVTGGATGIGRSAVLALARAGFDVAINYLTSEAAARDTAAEAEALGAKTRLVQCDVADDAGVRAMIEGIRQTFGRLDALVNNAGVTASWTPKKLDTLSLEGAPDASNPDRVEATQIQVASRRETPLEEVEARELGSAIEQAIGELRPEYRSCIILRHIEGRSYEEIAQTLDLPLGTVKTYIHRARAELMEILGPLRE